MTRHGNGSKLTLSLLSLLLLARCSGSGPSCRSGDGHRRCQSDNSDHDPIDPDGATGGRVNGIVVDPNDGSVLYAASEWGGIYQTVDTGLTWQRL